MVIHLATLVSLLWFLAILFVALSFPLQVYTQSPYPSLVPYVLIGLIALISFPFHQSKNLSGVSSPRGKNIDLMVKIYFSFILFSSMWQVVLGVVSLANEGAVFVVYLLPVVWYWYFSKVASDQDVRWVLWAIVVAGLVVGLYFSYDSYLKLALGQVSDYAREAFQYSLSRSPQNADDANDFRVSLMQRSFGLLESHSVSGTWTIMGSLAALSLVPKNRQLLRRLIVFLFGAMLLMGLNFTSIISYFIIMFFFEFSGLQLLRGKVSIKNMITLLVVLVFLVSLTLQLVGKEMAMFIIDNLSGQKDMMLGSGGGHGGVSQILMRYSGRYVNHIVDYPLDFLLGDGFTAFVYKRGGDIGVFDTIVGLGAPFFIAVIVGFMSLVRVGLGRMVSVDDCQTRMLCFAICTVLLVLIMDCHYSVWSSKAVLPVVFLSLAFFSRYLSTTKTYAMVACGTRPTKDKCL